MKYVTMETIMMAKDVSKDARESIPYGFVQQETQHLHQNAFPNVAMVLLLSLNTAMTET